MILNKEIVKESAEYVRSLLAEKLPGGYCYHNYEHAEEVAAAVDGIAGGMQLTYHERCILLAAAWFHDVGYVSKMDGHEAIGAETAAAFLQRRGVDGPDIQRVRACILATRYPQSPKGKLEEVICDADLLHLGRKDFFEKTALIRREWIETKQKRYTDEEWHRSNLDFMRRHRFHTSWCEEEYGKRKKKNCRLVAGMLEAAVGAGKDRGKDPEKLKLERGVETFFKTASRNHMQLAGMADNKAHILLSINSIIISIVVSAWAQRMERKIYLIAPAGLLLLVCMVSMIFAVLTTKPKISKGTFTREQVIRGEANLMFFGNFHSMDLRTYAWGVRELMMDNDYLYSSLTKDVYYLGKILAIKYRYLNIGYKVFMYGLIASVLMFGLSFTASAQERVGPGTVRMAANTSYDSAGKVKRFFLGEHYRREWATEVEFAVLDLDSAGGGLTPLRLGGGLQTRSLRLKGMDGKEYVLRSVNKDPSKALPPEMAGTFANDVLQDQISSSNPYAAPVVAALAGSAGILHSTPRMVYVPFSPRLAQYEKDFAGTLCLFEERPSGDVVNSQKLYEKIKGANDHRVDEKAFLKARLFDIWIGDWDRHDDQWLWAESREAGRTIYRPIPRDRDQAFAKLDGLIPQAASRRWAIRKTQNFDYTIRDIDGLNMAGHFLDRHFLTRLSLADWMEVCRDLQGEMTNAAIDSAFRNMPPAIFSLSGESIIAKLRQRREELKGYAVHYYHFLAGEVNIAGTADAEVFEVSRLNEDSTVVTVFSTNKVGQRKDTVFHRVFLRSETDELRLYSLGGKDRFEIGGPARKGTLIRVIKGKEEDVITDSARAGRTRVYDESYDRLYSLQSFRYDWLSPKWSPGYNPDDGIYLGGGVIFQKQQFGKYPYGFSQSIWGNYAFSTGAYNFGYIGIFREFAGKWDLHLDARINAPNYVRNYYGLGNETQRMISTRGYYNIRSTQYILTPSLYRLWKKRHSVEAGVSYQSIQMERTEGRFVSAKDAKLDSGDFRRANYVAPFLKYQFSTLDNPLYPHRGITIGTTAGYTRSLEDSRDFWRLSGESSIFQSVGHWTAGMRTGVATNVGNGYAFYQANILGGTENLRGYRRDRFAGKTSFYTNAELRYRLDYFKGYFFRGEWGLLSFFDCGRVWMPGETSHEWHSGYGGGIWFLPYNKMAFTVTYGMSKEDRIFSMKAGFLF